MSHLEVGQPSELSENYNNDTEELSALIEEYRLSALIPFFFSSGPTQYIGTYAEITDQTSPDEAREKMDRINKAIAIDELRSKKKTYTEEEKNKIYKEVVDYILSNKDQYSLLSDKFEGSKTYPDGRKICSCGWYIGPEDAAELFWNLRNDTMSIEAWACFCENGTMERYKYYIDDSDPYPYWGRRIVPLIADFQKELLHQEAELRRASHPDIFAHPDETLIKSNTTPFLRKIDSATVHKILKKHREDFKACSEEMTRYLSLILELDEVPQIEYEDEAQDTDITRRGSYSSTSNTITLYFEKDRDKKTTFEDINTIAHEIWHAHQHLVADKLGEELSSELYKKNFRDYIEPEEDYCNYRTQLVEVEARTFAELFVNRYCIPRAVRFLREKQIGRKILACVLASTMGLSYFSIKMMRDNKNSDQAKIPPSSITEYHVHSTAPSPSRYNIEFIDTNSDPETPETPLPTDESIPYSPPPTEIEGDPPGTPYSPPPTFFEENEH